MLAFISCKNSNSEPKLERENQEVFLDSVKNQKELKKEATIVIPTNIQNIGKISNISYGCGYNYEFEEDNLEILLPNNREIDIINKILSYSGIPSNFEIYKANIQNAVATIIENQRYIIYDENLFNLADNATKSNWSSISILAHEVGHHLSGHTMISSSNQLKSELEADKFSGFILYKMGANLDEATKAISLFGTSVDTDSHPSKSKRISAIEKGWNEANRQRYEAALPPPPNDDLKEFYTFDSSMLINSQLRKAAKENSPDFYTDYGYLKGVITEVDPNFNSFKIRILKMENSDDYWRDLTGEEWDVNLDEVNWGGENEMCHACAFNFQELIIPGRRLRFSMVEAYPGAGTSMNGVWFLTYAERLKGNSL